MRREHVPFKEALARMGGDQQATTSTEVCRGPSTLSFALPDADWQAAAWTEIDKASSALLHAAEGSIGRQYLLGRALHSGTWNAWQLGVANVFDPKARCTRPAVALPSFDFNPSTDTIAAIKYRFIDENPQGLRYVSRRGSVPVLFGLWDAVPEHSTLLTVEGEINALSVWQCLPSGVTCLSFGSEAGVRIEVLRALASRYQRVFVWADEAKRARELGAAMGPGVQAVRSPEIRGEKWDANKMLQGGILSAFVSGILGVQCLGKV
jgi:hypothetical protein